MLRPCLVYSTIDLVGNLILLAGLSYLGFGVQPPTAELGSIIADGQGYLLTAWWIATLPGLVLVLFGVGVGLIGEGISDRGLERGGPMSLLEIEALRVEFPGEDGPLVAVKGVDLAIEPGEVLGLVGESGSGKSLTCRAVMRMVPEPGAIASGSIRFDGEDVIALGKSKLRDFRAHSVGMIYQNPFGSLNPTMRVGAQIAETLRVNRGLRPRRRQGRGGGAARPGRDRGPRAPLPRLPARALRRHVPAGDDRDRHRLQPAADARRRADHGARRHHPGADPQAARRRCAPSRGWRCCSSPTTSA